MAERLLLLIQVSKASNGHTTVQASESESEQNRQPGPQSNQLRAERAGARLPPSSILLMVCLYIPRRSRGRSCDERFDAEGVHLSRLTRRTCGLMYVVACVHFVCSVDVYAVYVNVLRYVCMYGGDPCDGVSLWKVFILWSYRVAEYIKSGRLEYF